MKDEKNTNPSEPKTLRSFGQRFPHVWDSYQKLRDSCDGAGPLQDNVKELIKVAVSAALKRHGGLIAHLDRARALGATEDELYQTILLTLPLVGFPDALAAFRIVKERLGG